MWAVAESSVELPATHTGVTDMWHTGQDPPLSSKDIVMVHNTTSGPELKTGHFTNGVWKIKEDGYIDWREAPDYWCYMPDRYTQVPHPEQDKVVKEIYSILQSISDQSKDVRAFIDRLKSQNTRHKDEENGKK